MNIGEIWGAAEDPIQRQAQQPDFKGDLEESALLIHHKIVSMNEQFSDSVSQVDQDLMRDSCGMTNKAWKAVLNLDLDYFDERPMNTKRVQDVATALSKLSNEQWLHAIAKRKSILPDRSGVKS